MEELSGTSCPTSVREGFASGAAEKFGMTKRTINRHLFRADNIEPGVMELVKDMPAANNGVDLDALAKLGHFDQK